jgi:hypothetical protein
LTAVKGLSFEEAEFNREVIQFLDLDNEFVGPNALHQNKRAP